MGTVQNRALKSLHEGSLEITLTIQSLKLRNTDCIHCNLVQVKFITSKCEVTLPLNEEEQEERVRR